MRPVIDRLDHQMLNELAPFTEINPSAENLARYFYDETNQQLASLADRGAGSEGLHNLN